MFGIFFFLHYIFKLRLYSLHEFSEDNFLSDRKNVLKVLKIKVIFAREVNKNY